MDGRRFLAERNLFLKSGRTIKDADASTIGVSTSIKGHETLWIVIPPNYPFTGPHIGGGELVLMCVYENGDCTNICNTNGWHPAACLERIIAALERGEKQVELSELMMRKSQGR